MKTAKMSLTNYKKIIQFQGWRSIHLYSRSFNPLVEQIVCKRQRLTLNPLVEQTVCKRQRLTLNPLVEQIVCKRQRLTLKTLIVQIVWKRQRLTLNPLAVQICSQRHQNDTQSTSRPKQYLTDTKHLTQSTDRICTQTELHLTLATKNCIQTTVDPTLNPLTIQRCL